MEGQRCESPPCWRDASPVRRIRRRVCHVPQVPPLVWRLWRDAALPRLCRASCRSPQYGGQRQPESRRPHLIPRPPREETEGKVISAIYLAFFFNDTPTTEIYTLSLHDALP